MSTMCASMSHPSVTNMRMGGPRIERRHVENLVSNTETQARMFGLIAMLALPARRAPDGVIRRVLVEIEAAPGMWMAVDRVAITSDELVLMFGTNGTTKTYKFMPTECPRWRAAKR